MNKPLKWQSVRGHLRWILPLMAFLAPSLAVIHDRYGEQLGKYYSRDGYSSCGLARGYARKFEAVKGHRPTIEELRSWALERFKADLNRMEIGFENPEWIGPAPEPPPRHPVAVPGAQ